MKNYEDRGGRYPRVDIFCVFLHLCRAVLVRYSATSSSDSRERHFLVHS